MSDSTDGPMVDSPAVDGPVVDSQVASDRALLAQAHAEGFFPTLKAFVKLSGPGWLQSAITLGGGTLASSLYLGVLAGYGLLWLQPAAMILGVIMLSAIAYVTTSTGERPFPSINRHINPVLGWGWALASLMANMVWCLPQFSLANAVIQQNLAPKLLGEDSSVGDFNGKLIISITLLVVCAAITWCYDRGGFGVRLYERILKLMVGGVVICFFGVVVKMALASSFDWGVVFAGFIPDLGSLSRPAAAFQPMLDQIQDVGHRAFWSERIVAMQRDVTASAAATAVGINMTFLFPYSMLRKGWTKEFRGLAIFDLSTGMFIPFVLATSCVIIAAAHQFHGQPVPGFVDAPNAPPNGRATGEYVGLLAPRIKLDLGEQSLARLSSNDLKWADLETPLAGKLPAAVAEQLKTDPAKLSEADRKLAVAALGDVAFAKLDDAGQKAAVALLPEAERRVAASLVTRDAFDLAGSLKSLFDDEKGEGGEFFANLVFGLGVLGMTVSTITLLMLISGFVICEMLDIPAVGWPYRFGCLAAGVGALGPFVWGKAAFYLAVPASVFGLILLPIAYLTFFLMMNQKKLLGEDMPRGLKRLVWNTLMLTASSIALFASAYMVFDKTRWYGVGAVSAFILLAVVVHFTRPKTSAA